MPTKRGIEPKIGDVAVQRATGKTWKQWFSVLDRAGSTKKSHKQIVAYLGERHAGLNLWWRQMVTVAYEQARGMRDLHEKRVGYEISVSRTVPVDVGTVFKAWKDKRYRSRWLSEDVTIRTSTPNRSMRITWNVDGSALSLNFNEKTDSKSQIVVQHSKLSDVASAAKMKKFWGQKLDSLKKILTAKS